MAIIPPILQNKVDPILQKIRRFPLYVNRYNNTLGLRLNEAYMRYARDCSSAYKKRHGKRDFRTSGVNIKCAELVQGILSAEECKKYSNKITNLIESNDKNAEATQATKNLSRKIKHPLRNLGSDYLHIFEKPELHEALLAFFHSDYRIEWVSAFRSLPSNDIHSTWMWHSDSFPSHTCKLFLHLTPATGETGATEFISPDDTKAFRRAGYFGQFKKDRLSDLTDFAAKHGLQFNPYHIDAQTGDGSVFNMNYFHHAVAPRHSYRDVIEFYLLPNEIPWNEQLKKDGIDKLECIEPHYYPKNPKRS